ncbi:hypothetical protein BW723_13455 [Polaribacter reichenbachii]|uniref:Thioredoxin domain-containing protein n=1 Tax=Polaribacter reichenbachii TaxID=996801 RepID=A0A1B8U199_9FLAO|nr:hypothetical protein [Polaribacter reichenbachii]APZ47227.1 hypothetical protein BW723_13455 [Polaribacter reichenbachii]AUC17868.1 hypothetical protein BTO17_03910 [Polaribacter reichenbachii]OBY65641.1 hypothetical protein LPB301_08325 [Polaribacter reichenbachii]
MTKKIILLLQISYLITLFSCNSDKKSTTTYFGGKIINPKTNHIVLHSMDKVIDTFLLDSKNKFIGEIKNANEGLYYFYHGNEKQHIYLEVADSVMIRLNTWDFDESLVFAGKGAERNNVLIDCFLEGENDQNLFYKYNRLSPTEFKQKADSVINIKLNRFNEYIDQHPKETIGFKQALKTALTFPIYSRIERYPLMHTKYTTDGNFPSLSSNFYNYRNNISINKDSLMYYPPYSRYIRNYLYNKTYALGHPPMKNKYSSEFTVDLLNIIDKEIITSRSKNAFLRQTIISHFYNKSSCDINAKAFDTYFKLSTNDEDKMLLKNLVNDTKLITANDQLPNFNITNYSDAKHKVYDIIKGKNTLLFFWSPEYVSRSYIETRIIFLSKNYPNIQFIQVMIDGNKGERIQKLDIKNQFYLDKSSEAHQFLTSKMPRSILINKRGKVINGYGSIASKNLNPYLEELSKN